LSFNQRTIQSSADTSKTKSSDQSTDTSNAKPAFVANGSEVTVKVKASESDYDNKIYWSTDNFKTKNYVAVDNNAATVNIGSFKAGTKIEFGIENGANQFYRTGDASQNSDGIAHAKVSTSDGVTTVKFEDLANGGDSDFDDAVITVQNSKFSIDVPEYKESKTSGKDANQESSSSYIQPQVGNLITGASLKAQVYIQSFSARVSIIDSVQLSRTDLQAATSSLSSSSKDLNLVGINANPAKSKANDKLNTLSNPYGSFIPPAINLQSDPQSIGQNSNRLGLNALNTNAQNGYAFNNNARLLNTSATNQKNVGLKQQSLLDDEYAKKMEQSKEREAEAEKRLAPDLNTSTKLKASDKQVNHSGLGDNTNPGNGIVGKHIFNSGVANPSHRAAASTSDVKLLNAILKG
jgi:hypothetical protein